MDDTESHHDGGPAYIERAEINLSAYAGGGKLMRILAGDNLLSITAERCVVRQGNAT
jgi:hypothetical protein